jgi:hypothetical protein
MRGLSKRASALKRRVRKRRREKEKKRKQNIDSHIPTWRPRFLYLLDIEAIRGIPESQLENALTHCERISYKEWKAAKGKRSRRKPEKWYLVLNPPGFPPVTVKRLMHYL